nr:PREDICTED: myeloma-overexpressed gene 2 protein isoform X1 [Latimeria chalumnae]|eukprot:XP_014341160.1 PREDICTED: myeloma-overexpressed gene 2 protein isoform X1 [Latimeria chalumnae]
MSRNSKSGVAGVRCCFGFRCCWGDETTQHNTTVCIRCQWCYFGVQAGGSSGLLMDLAANEKAVHADFFNDFEDLFDDDDIQ